MSAAAAGFADALVVWQRTRGRHDLPWQGTRDPYRIWLSEVMLQQTQVAAVIPYYLRFLQRFPDLPALAAASEEEVLTCWAGLGYYARGRNLHRAARLLVEQHGGTFPQTAAGIAALPGVGESTAAAVAVFAYGAREAILDGNVRRVLARVFAVPGQPGAAAVQRRLWALARDLLPVRDIEAYTQGLMDLGATLCTRATPACGRCPVAALCQARALGQVARFPEPRARSAVPQREARYLVAVRQGEVLLERRPSPGIWGGLWCFPELEGPSAEAALVARGLHGQPWRALEAVEHGFTHFRLTLHPVLVWCGAGCAQPAPGQLWLDLAAAPAAAVPVPVRRILARLPAVMATGDV